MAVASLLIIRRGVDVVGQCDELCYDAKHDKCVCKACEGRNHGAGLEQAIANTRAMVDAWDEPGTQVEVPDLVQNLTLFPLPQE